MKSQLWWQEGDVAAPQSTKWRDPSGWAADQISTIHWCEIYGREGGRHARREAGDRAPRDPNLVRSLVKIDGWQEEGARGASQGISRPRDLIWAINLNPIQRQL